MRDFSVILLTLPSNSFFLVWLYEMFSEAMNLVLLTENDFNSV